MTTFNFKLSALVIAWLAVLAAAAPDAARSVLFDDTAVLAQGGSSARERWESLSPVKRERLVQRFERLKKLEASERALLKDRVHRLRMIERRIVSKLSDADRERLMLQPAERRSQLLSELVEAEVRNRGQRIEAKLPKEMREWLAKATPEERRSRLKDFKFKTRERMSVAAVEKIATALGFGEPEIARLARLPVEQRMQKVLELTQRLSKEEVERAGLPKGLTAKRWKELDRLPPSEYFAEVMALQVDGLLGRALRHRKQEGEGAQERREARRDLARQLSPKPAERLELSELSPAERKRELDRRRRARSMRVVRERKLLNERELQTLEALSDRDFFKHARRIAHRAKVAGKPGAHGEARPGAHGEARPGVRGEAQPGARGEAQPGARGEAQPGARGEAQPRRAPKQAQRSSRD